MLSIDITVVSVFFLAFAVTYVAALAWVVVLGRRREGEEGEASEHPFSLIVPARNEQEVLVACLESLLALDYRSDRFEILVVDDGSSDATGQIVAEFARRSPDRVRLLQVPSEWSGRGKPSALNRAFRFLDEFSPFRYDPNWIVGIFDADGQPDRDMLNKASFQFRSRSVAGVQASVRIRNRGTSWLTRMQDIEFAGFSRVTQLIRMRFANSAALGGNGQFVRASALRAAALDRAEGIYWNPRSLTEDLDLSARLLLLDLDLRHLHTSSVSQEGVETPKALFRQRTRWAWGSLQVFSEYVLRLKVFRATGVRLRKRLDLLFNLSIFLVSPLVFATWVLTGLAVIGLVSVLSAFPGAMMTVLSFGYLPLVGYGLSTVKGYPKLRLPLDLLGFALYTYHWVPCLYVAMWRLLSRTGPIWWKTVREGEIIAS